MPTPSYPHSPILEHWQRKVFWPAWLTQEALAFALPILTFTAGRLLYRLIPHREQNVPLSFFPAMHAAGGTPEETAPLEMAIGFFICNLFALLTVFLCFLEILLLKCCCIGCLNPISYAILNLIQCAGWAWASGTVGSVLWRYESYTNIHLLEKPVWWAAFLLQVVYGLAFLVPAFASIRCASMTWQVAAAAEDEERRPLIVVVDGRRERRRDRMPGLNYGT